MLVSNPYRNILSRDATRSTVPSLPCFQSLQEYPKPGSRFGAICPISVSNPYRNILSSVSPALFSSSSTVSNPYRNILSPPECVYADLDGAGFQSLQEYPKPGFPRCVSSLGGSFQSLQEYPKRRCRWDSPPPSSVSNPYRNILSSVARIAGIQAISVSNPYRNILSPQYEAFFYDAAIVSNPYRNTLSCCADFLFFVITWFPILTGIS